MQVGHLVELVQCAEPEPLFLRWLPFRLCCQYVSLKFWIMKKVKNIRNHETEWMWVYADTESDPPQHSWQFSIPGFQANGRREHVEASLATLSLEPVVPHHQLRQPPPLAAGLPMPPLHSQYAAYPVLAPQHRQPQVLLAPSHFQQPAELMQDPAIMSFRWYQINSI